MKYLALAIVVMAFPFFTAAAVASKRLRRLIFYSKFMVITLPFCSMNLMSTEFYRGTDKGFMINAGDLAALVLAICMVVRYRRNVIWFPLNSLPALVFFCLSVVSTINSEFPILSSFTLFKELVLFLNYWSVYNYTCLERPALGVKSTLKYVSVWIILVVLVQRYVLGLYPAPGPTAIGGHQNALPTFIIMYFSMLMMWTLHESSTNQMSSLSDWLVYIGLIGAVTSTFSRAGIVFISLTFTLSIVVSMKTARKRLRFILPLVLVLCALFAIKVAKHVAERFETAPEESRLSRLHYNAAAMAMAEEHPIGVGPNLYSYMSTTHADYRKLAEPELPLMTSVRFEAVDEVEGQSSTCHNIYLMQAAETGYFGLGLMCLMMARFWWAIAKSGYGRYDLRGRVLLGLSVGIFAAMVLGLIEPVLLQPISSRLYVSLCGFGLALANLPQGQRAR